MDSWRTWDRVRPALERRHVVLAPAHVGHMGGPPLEGHISETLLADFAERAMDGAGFETAHVAGNSLGGYVALQLAERGRARSVVALAPAGGWVDARSRGDLFRYQRDLHANAKWAVPHAEDEVAAQQMLAVANTTGAPAFIDFAEGAEWPLDPERITCPLRFVWGTHDELLSWPSAAERYRAQFPHADWIELDGVGHYPQLERPTETADLILGLTAR